MSWQKASGFNRRAKVEAAIARWKQMIGDGLRSRRNDCRALMTKTGAKSLPALARLALAAAVNPADEPAN